VFGRSTGTTLARNSRGFSLVTDSYLRRPRLSHSKETATLCGWVDGYRDHGGIVFIDLRDRYGLTQVVFDPDNGKEMLELAQTLRGEDVIQVTGVVAPRPANMVNAKLLTGEIDLYARELKVLNKSKTPRSSPALRICRMRSCACGTASSTCADPPCRKR
jgi:aspartyl-tRNA synthetase